MLLIVCLLLETLLFLICLCAAHAHALSLVVAHTSQSYLAYLFMPVIGALYAFGGASWLIVLFLLMSTYHAYKNSYKNKSTTKQHKNISQNCHLENLLIICLQIHVISGWCAFHKYDILYGVPAGGHRGQAFYTYILATCAPALQKLVPEILLVFLFISFALIFPWNLLEYVHHLGIFKSLLIKTGIKKTKFLLFKETKRLRTYEPALWAQECCSYWYRNTQDLTQF